MPGAAFIEKLLLSFPDLNARWLLTGAGDMIEKKETGSSKVAEPIQIAPEKETIGTTRTEPPVKSVKNTVAENESGSAVDKIVLLFSDGTFIDYKKK